jgi:hypothetical protein
MKGSSPRYGRDDECGTEEEGEMELPASFARMFGSGG